MQADETKEGSHTVNLDLEITDTIHKENGTENSACSDKNTKKGREPKVNSERLSSAALRRWVAMHF